MAGRKSPTRVLPALLLLCLAGAGPAPTEADEAQQAYTAGRYDVARRLWTAQAEAGDPAAQLNLGTLYDLGQGVPRDPLVAYGWYRLAAVAGEPAAEFNMAAMSDSGDGVPRNPDQAEAWFRVAAPGLPAAAEKLAALRRAGNEVRSRSPAPADAARPIEAAQPVAPMDGDVLPVLPGAPGTAGVVEVVWVSPAQPVQVRFFVQLLALDPIEPREVFATFLDETAILATLDRVPGRYAWRVYAVGRNVAHYAASEWNQFQVRPPG